MATYTLTAKHYTPEFGVERHVKTIHADDTTDATFAAIRYIMDTAMTESAWANFNESSHMFNWWVVRLNSPESGK